MESAHSSTKLGLRKAIPGAIFIGSLAGLTAGIAGLSSLPSESAASLSAVLGAAGFVLGAALMLLLYHRTGSTIGSIGQAIKNLIEAIGKW